jgi:hypothetical protein
LPQPYRSGPNAKLCQRETVIIFSRAEELSYSYIMEWMILNDLQYTSIEVCCRWLIWWLHQINSLKVSKFQISKHQPGSNNLSQPEIIWYVLQVQIYTNKLEILACFGFKKWPIINFGKNPYLTLQVPSSGDGFA